jgi:PKD repeat protein
MEKIVRKATILAVVLILFLNEAFTINYHVQCESAEPPQASFTYAPAKPYLNMTITFDASFSSPEGFNDIITSYTWDFGDGTPKITVDNPIITHAYTSLNTFIIVLNVTDGEGLWGACSKPITIYPEFGPTANFTWTPQEPIINETITFDASGSTPGWCANTQRFSPIQTYIWNFGDGTGNTTTTNATNKSYATPGNYTVTLTIIDADQRMSQTTALITVLNVTIKTYDVNGDGKIDLKDVYRVAKAYGSFPGHPKWDPACDFNKDDKVDLKDYYPVCKHYGEDP